MDRLGGGGSTVRTARRLGAAVAVVTSLVWGGLGLTATPSGAGTPRVVGIVATPTGNGYYLQNSAGPVDGLGTAPKLANSNCEAPALTTPVIGVAPTPDHRGFWKFNAKGGVACLGDAKPSGELQGQPLPRPIVGMTSTLDGMGYLMAAAGGGLFHFGDACYLGSPASSGTGPLPSPIVSIALSPLPGSCAEMGGYWMVSATGTVYPYGNALRYSSLKSTSPVVALAPTADGKGYWIVARDGQVWHFGDAGDHGSTKAPATEPIVAMATTPDGQGYWLLGATGIVYPHGDAVSYGNAA
jgi:hypothetical protein